MAITNAQQYQQLVNKPANGKRPGYRGDDAYGSSSRSRQATDSRAATSSTNSSAPGGSSGQETRGDGPASNDGGVDRRQTYNVNKTFVPGSDKVNITKDDYDRGQSNFREQFNEYLGGSRPMSLSQRNNQKYQNRIFNQARTNIINQLKQAGLLTDEDDT